LETTVGEAMRRQRDDGDTPVELVAIVMEQLTLRGH
jgi:hypothetical protein